MKIRLATTTDIDKIAQLYYDTILTVNSKDYSKEQIEAWASTYNNQEGWVRRMEEQYFYVAILDKIIVGFASMDKSGYFDLLYIHKDHQRKGIATALAAKIEEIAKETELPEITVQSSITAKPFFERIGYKIYGEKQKTVHNVPFTNALMAKKLVAVIT
jgi:putative acetyltransferase